MIPDQASAAGCRPREIAALHEEVRALAAERNATILAHNYQVPEIQDVADYVGDSLGLSRRAAAGEAEVIAFCGVHFMAETASILCPEKTVLIPDLDAGCSLAASIDAEQLADWRAEHPGGVVVMYVNTTAEVKALTDYCCTSANAVDVVRHIYETHGPETEILFGPDMWLGAFVEKELGRPMHVWDGECHVHAGIRPADIEAMRAEHPGAELPDPSRVRLCDQRDGVRRRRRHLRRGRAHALDRRHAQVCGAAGARRGRRHRAARRSPSPPRSIEPVERRSFAAETGGGIPAERWPATWTESGAGRMSGPEAIRVRRSWRPRRECSTRCRWPRRTSTSSPPTRARSACT